MESLGEENLRHRTSPPRKISLPGSRAGDRRSGRIARLNRRLAVAATAIGLGSRQSEMLETLLEATGRRVAAFDVAEATKHWL